MEILLREWRRGDIEMLVKLANNKNIADNLRDRFPYPYTLKDAEEWLILNEVKKPATNFAIEADGNLTGGCGLMMKDDVYRYSAEVGYWIAEQYWGKGIATKAIQLLLEKTLPFFPELVRVYAEVFEHNKASMRVLEKNGFHLEGIRKKAVIKNNFIMNDHIWVKLVK
jgi:ribosomal-protein-alanine N-acetyltransferase